jgi:hypothetical protein
MVGGSSRKGRLIGEAIGQASGLRRDVRCEDIPDTGSIPPKAGAGRPAAFRACRYTVVPFRGLRGRA